MPNNKIRSGGSHKSQPNFVLMEKMISRESPFISQFGIDRRSEVLTYVNQEGYFEKLVRKQKEKKKNFPEFIHNVPR